MIQMRILLLILTCATTFAQTEPPKTWVDPDTGHRVVRLTDEPGSASLYFNQNGYTPDGTRLVFTTPNGISTFDLKSHVVKQIVPGRVRIIEVGHKTGSIFYINGRSVFVADVNTGASREIGTLPERGSVVTVNADETLLGGTYTEAQGPANNTYALPVRPAQSEQSHPLDQPANKEQMMEQRLASHIPMGMFVMSTLDGKVNTIHKSTEWLNHLLFSPTDPTLLMFCHEGPWHKVDRIWTIRTDGSQITKVHTRTMAMEIYGHEFWSADGKTIWYDLQTPRGEDFWLASYRVDSGERAWYHLQRNEWSIHFNVTRDGSLMCGDGGDKGQVARATDGQWIYLFRPELIANRGIDEKGMVMPGVLHAEKLVNMAKHQYKLEPNVSFSPDGKWVIFRSNMFGPTYVFAASVEKDIERDVAK